jgi:hypothetical protein
LTAINDILSTFFAAEKNISKDISTTLLVQPLIKTRTGAGGPGQKGSAMEDLVRGVALAVCVRMDLQTPLAMHTHLPCALSLERPCRGLHSMWASFVSPCAQGGVSAAIAPPSGGLDASSTAGGNESGADDSDVEEATATAALTSLYSPIHAKKVAWRALRDIILETGVFDTSRQPTSADLDPSPGTCRASFSFFVMGFE